jgi:hypothetical protein
MNVVGHPAIRVNPRRQAMNCLSNNIIQTVAIGFGEEHGLAVVTPESNVVEAAWNMQAEPARHRSTSTLNAMGARA